MEEVCERWEEVSERLSVSCANVTCRRPLGRAVLKSLDEEEGMIGMGGGGVEG